MYVLHIIMIIVESIIVIIIHFICIVYPYFFIASVISMQVPIKYQILILCEASHYKGKYLSSIQCFNLALTEAPSNPSDGQCWALLLKCLPPFEVSSFFFHLTAQIGFWRPLQHQSDLINTIQRFIGFIKYKPFFKLVNIKKCCSIGSDYHRLWNQLATFSGCEVMH